MFTFIVSKSHPRTIAREQIFGKEADFAATTREINHKMRDSHPRAVAAETFDDVEPGFERGSEVGDPLSHVALKNIIGPAAVSQQPTVKRDDELRIIIDALKEDHLVAKNAASVGEAVERERSLRGALSGVVEVGVDIDRAMMREHLSEGRCDPLRKGDRVTGANPDEINMRDFE